MPVFTIPLHEANDCHVPAGSPDGGQFCAKGSQLTIPFAAPTARRDNPYFQTSFAAGLAKGNLDGELWHGGSRVQNAQGLVNWAAEQIASSLGVPSKAVTVARVQAQNDMWGDSNGGYVHPSETDTLRLTARTEVNVEAYLAGDRGQQAVEGVAVVLHELMHAHSLKDTAAGMRQLLDRDIAGFFLARGVEEGLASHLSQQLLKRLTGENPRTSAYYLEQAIVRRMERKAGHNFIRDLYKASYTQRVEMIYQRFPKARNLGLVIRYGENMRKAGSSRPDDKGFKLILDVFNEAQSQRQKTVYPVLRRIWSARSRAELAELRRWWETQRSSFTPGEQLMVGEQWVQQAAMVQ